MQAFSGRKRNRSQFVGFNAPRKMRRRLFSAQPRRRRLRRPNARIAGFLGIEKKFYDTSLVSAVLTSHDDGAGYEHNPSATVCLNTVAQGDQETHRDGRKMSMKSITVSGNVEARALANQTVMTSTPIVRIYLVMDTQTNGALLNSEDVFVNPSGSTITGTSLFRNLQYISRFKVLKQVYMEFPPQMVSYDGTNIEIGGAHKHFGMHVKLADIPVNFTGTTSSIANIVDNSLHVIACAVDGTQLEIRMSYNARLRFVG